MTYLIVGCGLSGVVIAEQITSVLKENVIILEKRDHIGGNCYDYLDKMTNILVNKYGPHLFHTNNKEVWNYINTFDKWIRWEHKVLSFVDNKFVTIPVNISTINTLCQENLQTEQETNEWLKNNQVVYNNITNSEEIAKSRIGEILYNKLIKNYTYKQWNKAPNQLDSSVLARIPIYKNFDTRYFKDKYQALPHQGYTHFFKKILDNEKIKVELNTDYFTYIKTNKQKFKAIIFTGPIDSYFSNLEKLEYRSLVFEKKIFKNTNYYQPSAQVNYPSLEVPFTRITEYKHFLNQQSKDTIIMIETSTDKGEPYYPVPNKKNLELYNKYKELALQEESKNIYFVGRLANYKYFNMDEAILNSLEFFKNTLYPKFID